MITSVLNGGLGNQMFQYALGRNLSNKYNTDLCLDVSEYHNKHSKKLGRSYQLGIFDLDVKLKNTIPPTVIKMKIKALHKLATRKIPFLENPSIIYEKKMVASKEKLHANKKSILIGYWQSEKYFREIEDTIRKDFEFPKKISSENKKLLNQIKKTNSVSIHIRRGDYALNEEIKNFYGLLGLKYYQKANNIIEQKTKKPVWYIFSDDIEWCKENIKLRNATYVSHNKGDKNYEDMRLMSRCKHNIIANSSFSWWGAWLNNNPDKIVIAPKKWFATKKHNSHDIIPSSWQKV